MNRIRAWLRSFFGFSRMETNAFLILLPLMVLLIFSEPVYRYWFVHQPVDYSKEKKELDSIMATWKWDKEDSVVIKKSPRTNLFSFDPNFVSKDELLAFGFTKVLANRIVNYRLKGGKFKVKNDLLKIYGMDSIFFLSIEKYINLPKKIVNEESRIVKFERKSKPIIIKFDLNTADTVQLIKIYGIGSKLSTRIITYREKLGGFISEAQLKEVYALDSITIAELLKKFFIDEKFVPKQIDLNKATEKEFAAHPYIKYKLAKAITAYRFQHGPFNAVDDIKKIVLIDELKFQKIKPYLSVNP